VADRDHGLTGVATSPEDLQRTFTKGIAQNYDHYLGPAWFGPIAAILASRMPADPGGDVLEVACGTGLMTRPLRDRLSPSRRLVASDLSQPMLDYAREKLADAPGIEWMKADALDLPFADGEFAALACSLGVMFPAEKEKLFAQLRRVLRPGGLLLFTVWDRKELNTCVRVYSEVIEGMFPGDPEMQFTVPYSMHDTARLRELVVGAGFQEPKLEKVPITVRGDARDIAKGQVLGTPRGLLLTKRGVDLGEAIDKVTAALEQAGGTGAGFQAPGQVIVVEARA
jgi:ubiquinone/menaquinone biosynthesis C-methylase UbiE